MPLPPGHLRSPYTCLQGSCKAQRPAETGIGSSPCAASKAALKGLKCCLQGPMRRIALMNHIVTSMKMPQPQDPAQQQPCSAAELCAHILSTLHQLLHTYSMQGSRQGRCPDSSAHDMDDQHKLENVYVVLYCCAQNRPIHPGCHTPTSCREGARGFPQSVLLALLDEGCMSYCTLTQHAGKPPGWGLQGCWFPCWP